MMTTTTSSARRHRSVRPGEPPIDQQGRWARWTRSLGLMAAAITASIALLGCPQKTECTAQLVTGTGTYRGKGSGPANEPAVARRKATKDACLSMCLQTKAVNMETCPPDCVVDAEAGKVGVKITCTGDAAGSK